MISNDLIEPKLSSFMENLPFPDRRLAVLSIVVLLILYELTLILKIEYMMQPAGGYSGIGGTPFSNSFTASSTLS